MVAMNIIRIYELFPTESDCIRHLENVRWKGKPVCPYCGSDRATSAPAEQRYHCNNCKTSFSVTVGTIFHHTHLPLQKWLLAVSIVLNAKKGLSARQLARDLEVHRNTGWRMGMQIRKAMAEREQRELLSGVVEMDETYIGGKPRKGNTGSGSQDGGNKSRRGRGTTKTPVVGIVERHGRVVAMAVEKSELNAPSLTSLYSRFVDAAASIVMTDEYQGYRGLKAITRHYAVNHQVSYVVGDTHTNTIEGFWALVKRSIYGQHHHYSHKWANHYISETAYKYNNRKNTGVFGDLLRHMAGIAV
jgi:transposase-like protein